MRATPRLHPTWIGPAVVRQRQKRLRQTADDHDTADRTWDEYWAANRPVELTSAVEQHAGHLARTHALRGAEPVHLASPLAIFGPGLVIAIWHHRPQAGARAAGLRVAPAHL